MYFYKSHIGYPHLRTAELEYIPIFTAASLTCKVNTVAINNIHYGPGGSLGLVNADCRPLPIQHATRGETPEEVFFCCG